MKVKPFTAVVEGDALDSLRHEDFNDNDFSRQLELLCEIDHAGQREAAALVPADLRPSSSSSARSKLSGSASDLHKRTALHVGGGGAVAPDSGELWACWGGDSATTHFEEDDATPLGACRRGSPQNSERPRGGCR